MNLFFRLNVTHLVKSDEWVMGASWLYALNDADAVSIFLHALSRCYQQLKLLEASPVFERRLWRKDEADPLLLPTSTVLNYRGIFDSIAPSNLVSNCTLRALSDNFDDPYSLSSIAKSIRCSTICWRNPEFLER